LQGGVRMDANETFSQCLLEGDAEQVRRARRLRRKAMGISLVFEALLILAMLVVPLITQGVPPKFEMLTPLPPYMGMPGAGPAHPHAGPPARHTANMQLKPGTFYQPTHFPAHIDNSNSGNDEAPSLEAAADEGGPGIPGGTGVGISEGTGPREIAPPPPRTEKPRRVSIGAMEASLIYKVIPQYPLLARYARMSGDVVLRATITTDGRVRDLEVVSGRSIFIQAAMDAVRQWRYRPTRLDGEPVEVETIVTVKFVLD
jgi:periplasmic protein TonB